MGLEKPDAFIEKVDPEVERAYSRAVTSLQKDSPRLSMFSDLYGESNVRADYDYIQKINHSINEKRRDNPQFEESFKYGKIFEAIMNSELELSDWMGSNAHSIRTSEYDDIVNGIDEIVEFREENAASYLGLALDVTFGEQAVKDKVQRIKNEFDSGKLGQVKYFHSEFTHMTGRLSEIPRAIVSTDKETVVELTKLWMARDGKGDRKALAEHPIQIRMLDEIENQLSIFHSYLSKKAAAELNKAKRDRLSEMTAQIEDRMRVVSSILEDKLELKEKLLNEGGLREIDDRGFLALNEALREVFSIEEEASSPLSLKEKMDAQRALIKFSGMDPMIWIDAFSAKFRAMATEPEIIIMIRANLYDALPYIMERLEEEKAA